MGRYYTERIDAAHTPPSYIRLKTTAAATLDDYQSRLATLFSLLRPFRNFKYATEMSLLANAKYFVLSLLPFFYFFSGGQLFWGRLVVPWFTFSFFFMNLREAFY